MAEQEEIKGVQVTPEKAAGEAEPDAVELTAPAGWTKKVLFLRIPHSLLSVCVLIYNFLIFRVLNLFCFWLLIAILSLGTWLFLWCVHSRVCWLHGCLLICSNSEGSMALH